MENIFGQNSPAEENEWISFSDLMAVMMVIFLFISIIYWDRVPKNTQQIIQQKIQLEKDLKVIQQQTLLFQKLKESLEAEKEQIQRDLLAAIKIKEDLEDASKELEKRAKILQQQADQAEKDALTAINTNQIVNETLASFKNAEFDIYQVLLEEFRADLGRWNAEIIRENLIFRFKAPDVLFPSGSSDLTPRFKEILSDFVPRYVRVLKQFDEYIDEIRVEGHTSSEYANQPSKLGKYIANMSLSQDRTREVTAFSLLSIESEKRDWLQNLLTANGLSSSKLIREDGVEDRQNSRRVEFTVRTAIRKTLIQLENLNQ